MVKNTLARWTENKICSNAFRNETIECTDEEPRGSTNVSKLFFSPRMRHYAGRPTTDHYTETMEINTYSQRETDNYTQTLDK